MFRWIGGVITAILDEWKQFYEDIFTWEDPKIRLQNQLRRMYGQGEISAGRFLELRARLDRNQIGLGDIQMVHQAGVQRMRAGGQSEGLIYDREIARSLDRLFLDRGLLAEADDHIRQSLAALAAEARQVQAQVVISRQEAQAALPDEDRARAHLAIWQRMTHASLEIEVRRAAIADEQRRIAEMDAELRAAIAGLKLIDAQERLAQVRLHVRQDVYALAQKR